MAVLTVFLKADVAASHDKRLGLSITRAGWTSALLKKHLEMTKKWQHVPQLNPVVLVENGL